MNDKSTINAPIFLSHIKSLLLTKPVLVAEDDVLLLKNTFYRIQEKPKDFFILQIGDCAESFEDCTQEIIFQKCQFYSDIAKVLENRLQKKVVLIGRIAGQYAKPRTDEFEQQNGHSLPSYRGDMINGHEFDETSRKTDHARILKAYDHAANTIQFMNEFFKLHPAKKIFTSHEALVLEYESALTRPTASHPEFSHTLFNGSAHTVWLGDRTRNVDSLHVQYLATIENPIGIKIGPTQSPETLVPLLETLNPARIPGKLYLITRLGVEMVKTHLPKLIDAVSKENFPVLWCVDPMHGNTFKLQTGRKVRAVHDIIEETLLTAEIHQNMGTILSGIHLEATFLPVTECISGEKSQSALLSHDFPYYTTKCDPRLNPEQIHTFFSQSFY